MISNIQNIKKIRKMYPELCRKETSRFHDNVSTK